MPIIKVFASLLSQNQRLRNDFFDDKRYEALTKYIKAFFKKTLR